MFMFLRLIRFLLFSHIFYADDNWAWWWSGDGWTPPTTPPGEWTPPNKDDPSQKDDKNVDWHAKFEQRTAELKAKEDKWAEKEKKLAEYEAEEQKKLENEKKKKWEYEDLLKQKDEEITTLKEKATSWDNYVKQADEKAGKEIEELQKTLPKEVIEQNQDVLAKLWKQEQLKFLTTLSNAFKNANPDFKNNPWNWWNPPKGWTEYEKALADKDIKSALKFAPAT